MKYIIIFLSIFMVSAFTFLQDKKPKMTTEHHLIPNSEIVISIKVAGVDDTGTLLISSLASVDTSSEYAAISYDLMKFLCREGPQSIKLVDDGSSPKPPADTTNIFKRGQKI